MAATFAAAGFSTEVFSTATVVLLRNIMGTVMPRIVITLSTVRLPATDRVSPAAWTAQLSHAAKSPASAPGFASSVPAFRSPAGLDPDTSAQRCG